MNEVLNDLAKLVPNETSLLGTEQMADWDTARRQAFVSTLHARAVNNATVLQLTAQKILSAAHSRRFISNAQFCAENNPRANSTYGLSEEQRRTHEELDNLAEERAQDIINQLPSLKDALRVMAPELLAPMAQKERLTEAAENLYRKLDELSQPIDIADMDQAMTLGAFQAHLTSVDKARKQLVAKLDETAEKVVAIERQIAKALVRGVPEISTAILEAAKAQTDRATQLGVLSRRMGEQVMFGDSTLAMNVLKQFEADERELSTEFKSMFASALTRLKLTTPKKAKKGALRA